MVPIFRQMRFSFHFQNFAYFLAFSRYTFQNLNQRLHGIYSQPLHDPWSTKKNNIITSSMKLLSIKYHFWSILPVFSWTFFIGPPNTKKKCITDMLRFVQIYWYHFHWRIKIFFFLRFQSNVPLIDWKIAVKGGCSNTVFSRRKRVNLLCLSSDRAEVQCKCW